MHVSRIAILAAGLFLAVSANAQLSKNPDKFLGNITTGYQIDGGGISFKSLWNQITGENESKWSSIEGSRRGSFSWGGSDNVYNYAKNNKFPFKFHCLIWGSQYPSWMDKLSTNDQYDAIVEWMDAIKKHYNTIDLIDVVNEAVPGHAPAPYKNALGGDGKTGYDWIIKAFEMAYERWPDAILIYNDYNTFQWQKNEFINLCRILRDAGAPIDAYGCQSHDLTDMNFTDFKNAMNDIQNALKMPMYSSEYDIGTDNDTQQKKQYSDQIKYMWEQPYVAGITLWGYIYGSTWTTDGNSGIIKNGKDRPAMTWLREYMATDAAKTAKSPFPGMKKPVSLYIKPSVYPATINEEMTITVRARMTEQKDVAKQDTIDKIVLYINGSIADTLTQAPYEYKYTPSKTGSVTLKAVLTTTKGNKYERLGGFTVLAQRKPYKGNAAVIPGTVQFENFDTGGEGLTYHDSDNSNSGVKYRTDSGSDGVDIVTGNGGYAIGYTNSGEWLEYTVDVQQEGYYEISAVASSGATNSSFTLSLVTDAGMETIAGPISVPCLTQNNWDKYSTITVRSIIKLPAGKQIIRTTINGANCNLDKMTFKYVPVNEDIKMKISADKSIGNVGEPVQITVTPTAAALAISSIKLYVNDKLHATLEEAPYTVEYTAETAAFANIKAVAIDTAGIESMPASFTLPYRVPYNKMTLPAIIQFENFDKGGEGFTYHDTDDVNEGGKYRTDTGVDIVEGNGGYAIGYTVAGEWLEYTINVKQAGIYKYEMTASAESATDAAIFLGFNKNGSVTNFAKITAKKTGDWDTYAVTSGTFSTEFPAGQHILRIRISKAGCNLDKIKFTLAVPSEAQEIDGEKVYEYQVYSTAGSYLCNIKSTDSDLQNVVQNLAYGSGAYILRNISTGESKKIFAE